jgi:hypothetical protein
MITRTFTHSSPIRTSVTRVGTTRTIVSPARRVATTVHRPATTIVTSPVRRSVTVTSPLRATTTVTSTQGIMERARPVVDTLGMTRSTTIVRGALPTAKTYGRPVEINDTGITSPIKPTTITRLPAGPTSTFIHTSPLRRTVTYANPTTTTTVTSTGHIPTSPVRVTRTAPQVRESTTVYSPTRVTATTISPGRVVTNRVVSPGRTITEHAPRFIGSTNLATSTYIPAPAPTTTVTTTNVPARTVTRTSVVHPTQTAVHTTSQIEGTSVQVGNVTGNTYVSRVYSPSRRIAALTTSPSRVRIDNVGVHETYDPTVTTTTTNYF